MPGHLSIRSLVALAGICGCALGAETGRMGRTVPLGRFDREEAPRLTVYLVRHGESYGNLPALLRPRGLSKADLDSLTPRGKAQAAAVARTLAAQHITLVLSSPAQRTRQTAEAIAGAARLSGIRVEPALAPLRDGATSDGTPSTYSWRKSEWKAGRDPKPEGGESLREGLARARSLLEQIAGEQPGARIAVVSHGDIVAALLGHAEGTPILERPRIHDVSGGSISVLTLYEAPRWRLESEGIRP
jgi:broad specificity phosphatase PhoE